jgi:hypothetical protein
MAPESFTASCVDIPLPVASTIDKASWHSADCQLGSSGDLLAYKIEKDPQYRIAQEYLSV